MQLRTRIIKVAIKMFSERGFHRITMYEVARSAKCTEHQLASYYATKSDLFLAALHAADMARTNHGEIINILRDHTSFEEAVDQFARFVARVLDDTYGRMRIYGYLERPDLMLKFFEQSSVAYATALSNRIRMERVKGVVRSDVDPSTATAVLVFALGFRRLFGSMDKTKFDDVSITRNDISSFVDVWLHGVKSK